MPSVHIWPHFDGVDKGDGGVRRVVDWQRKLLPGVGWEIAETAEAADIIACHITIPPEYLTRFPEKPVVAHIHGLYWDEYQWGNWAYKANEDVMALVRVADAITAPSEWVANSLRRAASRPVSVVYHGVDQSEWDFAGQKSGYVLWNKTRHDTVCDSNDLYELASRLPDVQFVTTYIDKQLPNVTVTGRMGFEDGKRYIREAGIYLCTTRETFGIGTLEAMASGVPIVGFDWGGQREIFQNSTDAILVPPGDYDALADAVVETYRRWEHFHDAVGERSNLFSWHTIATEYAEIYNTVYANRRTFGPPAVSSLAGHAQAPPRVSIVVPAYGLDQYLDAALQSVADQTASDWECIIVDDASPDRCGEIADAWAAKDSRFRVIHNETNQYLSGARNTAILSARGAYILPLDADDRLVSTAVATLSKALDLDRTIHIAYGNVRFVGGNGRGPDEEWHSGWPIPYTYHQHVSLARNLLPYSSMYRRTVWEQIGGYRTRYRTGEDADFWIRAASYGFRPKMVTDEDTLVYLNREGSMSRVMSKVSWEAWYPWIHEPVLAPSGAVTEKQLGVRSLDPIVISVVIPVGPGHEEYLWDAIDSVAAQRFQNWECIVVNDTGSPFPRALPSWVRVLETPGKVGVAASRNYGIVHARGALYLPLDADDFLQPDALSILYEHYQATGHIVYGDFYEDPLEQGSFTVYHTPNYDRSTLVSHGCIHPVTALTPVSVWREVGGYDMHLSAWEDWAFQLRCAELCYCSSRVPVPVFTYRKWTGQRRSQNYVDFEASKASIQKRYGYFWESDKMAGCGSCGGGNNGYPPPNSVPMGASSPPVSGMTFIENVDQGNTGSTYRGRATGMRYYFEGGEGRYVFDQDVDGLLSLGVFRVGATTPGQGEQPSPVLTVAVAPNTVMMEPVREVEPVREPVAMVGNPLFGGQATVPASSDAGDIGDIQNLTEEGVEEEVEIPELGRKIRVKRIRE